MTEMQITDSIGDIAGGLDWLTRHTSTTQIQINLAKDRAISEALQAIQPAWTKEEIARRCLLVRCIGTQIEELFVDGVMVVQFQPAEMIQEWRDDRLVITYTQRFKRVRAVNPQAANRSDE